VLCMLMFSYFTYIVDILGFSGSAWVYISKNGLTPALCKRTSLSNRLIFFVLYVFWIAGQPPNSSLSISRKYCSPFFSMMAKFLFYMLGWYKYKLIWGNSASKQNINAILKHTYIDSCKIWKNTLHSLWHLCLRY
jgi:hypothetical protein